MGVFFVKDMEERNHLGDADIDGSIILKLKK
jgi:hypothetical protein